MHKFFTCIVACVAFLGCTDLSAASAKKIGSSADSDGFSLVVNTSIQFVADPRYVSLTLGFKLTHSGALLMNFSDVRIQNLAAALTPAVLRIGGTPEDSITYLVNGTECTNAHPPNATYKCSREAEYQYACLTMKMWGEWVKFASVTGLDLVFGLNACYGRPCDSCPMDFSNLHNFLNYTHANNLPVYGFEFGNELTLNLQPKAYATDVHALKAIMDDLWPNLPEQPKLILLDVSDTSYWNGSEYIKEFVSHFKDGVPAHALSLHEYPNCVPQNGSTAVLEPNCLDKVQQTAAVFAGPARGQTKNLWVGESADHLNGGIDGITNTFISSFYYADQLGALASISQYSLAARQCFIGGLYELVDHETILPNPDYWIAFLHKRLLSSTALGAALSGTNATYNATRVRSYAFCSTQGGVALLVINLDSLVPFTAGRVAFVGPKSGPVTGHRFEYHLGAAQVGDKNITCNGVPLGIDRDWRPVMPSTPQPTPVDAPLVVGPASIAFVQYPSVQGEC